MFSSSLCSLPLAIDAISLNDFGDCNEWLEGVLNDGNEAGNGLVHEGDTILNWQTVYEASGKGYNV